ncbi:putative RF-1 domain containing protein [Leishmania naiffi]|uniref:RF-1 domain containing protein n=1 Tax=Leishmania naiffi TaxID=5678 RepID=A0AAW3BS39_9TRYP
MLRRNTSVPVLQLRLLTTATPHPSRYAAGSVALLATRRAFFGSFGKQSGNTGSAGTSSGTTTGSRAGNASNTSSENPSTGVPPGFPPGLDLRELQTIQQLFNSQPKERQEQMMKQAMEMQKLMRKIPGFGKLAQKNTKVLEQLLKMPPQTPPPSSSSTTATSANTAPASASSTSVAASVASSPRHDLFSNAGALNFKHLNGSGSSSGPSLDELRKVNLGPEIEALFQELRTIRSRKNEYRDKYHQVQSALEKLEREHKDVNTREASLRSKLTKAEQEVMLLTSENMELRDSSKSVRQLTQSNRQLKAEVEQLKTAAQSSTAPGTTTYADLQQQLHEREDALRSLQRKLDRIRRRDPLLQFSIACSNVSRLCASPKGGDDAGSTDAAAAAASEASQEAAEKAFAELQTKYQERQQAAWEAAVHDHAAAAAAYVAVVRRYVMRSVPHSNYDAVVVFTGDAAALHACFSGIGFQVEMLAGEHGKAHVTATADALPFSTTPGPFGYALALSLSSSMARGESGRAGATLPPPAFTVTSAHPFVSAILVQNTKRCRVTYDTARASGPGGQATNVAETQVYAKLAIDGAPAFTAEAQDSRSALSNREAALEKLHQQRRLQYNDTLAKQEKVELVKAQLVANIRGQGGFALEEDVHRLVQEAVIAKRVTAGDAALVKMLQQLGLLASAA